MIYLNICKAFGRGNHDKVSEARLRWFGHAQRKVHGYFGQRMVITELPGRMKSERPQMRSMDAVKRGMQRVGC